MKLNVVDPPRVFEVGFSEKIKLSDCAHIELAADEQVTFYTESGAEYDVARKDWGFYATPSLNGRLKRFWLRGVLVKNRIGQYFVMVVEKGHEDSFQKYLNSERLVIITWMDDDEVLQALERKMESPE